MGDLGGHVRLVGVTRLERQLDQRPRRQRLEAAEPQDARQHLRPVPHRIGDSSLELPSAHPELRGDGGDARVRTVERDDGRTDERVRTRSGATLDRGQKDRVRVIGGAGGPQQRVKQRIGVVTAQHVGGIGGVVLEPGCGQPED